MSTVNTQKLTLVDWNEYVNPNYIEIEVSNGKKLQIRPKRSTRESAYQMWLNLLDCCSEKTEKGAVARAHVESTINQMATQLS